MSENPVHKNREKFNRPATHKDKKKEYKKGERKHKGDEIPPPTFAVIDADQPLYAAACVTETTWYVYKDKDGNEVCRFDSAKAGKNWIESIEFMEEDIDYGYTGKVEDLTREIEYSDDGIEVGKKAFERFLKQWVRQSGCKDYVAYISKGSGAENFRYELATIVPYKGNRSGSHTPKRLEELRKWARTLDHVKVNRGNVEVDDVVASISQRNKHKACSVSADKDSRQCVNTWILIPDEMDEPEFSDPNIVGTLHLNSNGKVVGLGWLFLLYQAAFGDTVDGIKGCIGTGSKGAYNLLREHSGASIDNLTQVVGVVAERYREAYGEAHTYINHHTGESTTVSWADIMIENLHLLYMKKSQKDVCPLIEIVQQYQKSLDSQAA